MNIKAIICDIEGTTTSISFVKDTLFSYAYENCENYLLEHFHDQDIKEIVKSLYNEAQKEEFEISQSDNIKEHVHGISKYVQKLIVDDRKVGPLKELQGKIWKHAFETNIISGHVFEDVLVNFCNWTEKGIKIYIYSSGSVEAQKLLFKYSIAGDLTQYITDYFDTKIGHKQEQESYENILKCIQSDPTNILFLSDIPKELYAAQKAGMNILLLNRPKNFEISETDKFRLKIVNNFSEINV